MGQLKNLHKRAIQAFRSDVAVQLKGEGYDFGLVVKDTARRQEKDFLNAAKGMRGVFFSRVIGIHKTLTCETHLLSDRNLAERH